MMFQSIAGLCAIIGAAWVLSEDRRRFPVRVAVIGIGMQFVFAAILLKVPLFRNLFVVLNKLVQCFEEATQAGTSFVFGYLGGGQLPFDETSGGLSYIFAFRALPLVLLMSALSSVLFYWKIMPVIVRGCSWGLEKTMGLGGAEGLSVAVNIFLGQVESPLFIRPYLQQITRSELFSVMTAGMGTIAGTVMVLYASMLRNLLPDAMGHILIASIITTPACVMIAKIMVPETQTVTKGELTPPQVASSTMDAITKGTLDGVELLINIIAMLVVLVAIVHLVNLILGLLPNVGGNPITLQRIFGAVMSPMVWLIGIPWNECQTAGSLMGTKTVLNEFIAYMDMSRLAPDTLSPRSIRIMTYALCGFANPGSLGIMIGGMGTMAPERRGEIVELGFRTIVSGTLATLMAGAVVGILE